jgi:thioredoxin reductase
MPPADLLAAGREEVTGYGVEIVGDVVVRLDTGFTVRLASGATLTARRILVATGAADELPDIPGARERWGRDFLHCPYCHGWEVRDQAIGVIGTGPGSVEHAQLLRQWSDDIVFFAHGHPVSTSEREPLTARGIEVIDGVVARFTVRADRLHAVQLADGALVPRAAVFMRPTLRPHKDGLTESLGCEADPAGFPRVGTNGQTSVPGVWVVGNAANPRAQVITAAGEGSAAAIEINSDLLQEDIQAALPS